MIGAAVAILPNAGLGNKLLVWARAVAFSRINDLPLYTYGWSYPRIGPLLRGERRDLFYGRHFKSGSWGKFVLPLRYAFLDKAAEPQIEKTEDTRRLFVFRQLPHWSSYFVSLHPHRALIRAAFAQLVRPSVVQRVAKVPAPIVSMHVRCGDFARLKPGQAFSEAGAIRTPLSYFTGLVHELRRCAGWCVPVTVFSDGTDAELAELLDLPHVARAEPLPDVAHLLLMARSAIVVPAATSTFGMWAGFLSDAALIVHPDHIHASIRQNDDACRSFEGPAPGQFETWPPQLVTRVRACGDNR